ncbi:hypothetical protein ACTJK4_23180 [Ralstonia sp. 22111]|uniref:hypothetical protein n=1 Tax=Ralstonia TaxID=48736 RepID=UPI003D96CF51
MTSEEMLLLEKRRAGFQQFYQELMPVLVDFAEKLGISPAHEILRHADQFVPYLDKALQSMAVADAQDRSWLLTRMGYFIGEYFVQKYGGCWYVNDIQGSRYFGRYVVGRFARLNSSTPMLDPFLVAQDYVDAPVPRYLEKCLTEVDVELVQVSKGNPSS